MLDFCSVLPCSSVSLNFSYDIPVTKPGTEAALNISGGLWIALVRSDADVPSVDVDVNITFRQAIFFSWGGWIDTVISFDVGAVDIDSGRIFPVLGTTTYPREREIWLGGSGGPIFYLNVQEMGS